MMVEMDLEEEIRAREQGVKRIQKDMVQVWIKKKI